MKTLLLPIIVILLPFSAYTQEMDVFIPMETDDFNFSQPSLSTSSVKQLKLTAPSLLPQTKNHRLLKESSNYQSYTFEETSISPKLKLKNSRTEKFFPHLGSAYHIKSDFKFNPNQRFHFSAGVGLIRIHTALSPNAIMKYSLNSQLQYSFSQWLKLRLYYQSVRNIRGQAANPLIHMNPLFPQSEYGAEVSAKIKNVQLDVGTKAIINNEQSNRNNLNMINSNISIGF